MPFDPDKYLANKQGGGFDPDAYLKKRYEDGEAEVTKLAEQKYEQTKPGVGETALLNAYQGITRNWGDELASKVGSFLGKDGDAIQANINDRVKRSEIDRPVLAGASKIVGEVATTPLTANPLAAAGIAGASGAARSLGAADELDGDAVKDAGVMGGIDAATAGMLTKFAPGLMAKVAEKGEAGYKWLQGALQSKANQQAVKSLRGTKGQYMKLEQSGKLDDVGKMLLDEEVVTPFASSGKIAERVANRGEDLAAQTGPIYDASANSKLSSAELGKVFGNRMNELNMDPGTLPVADQLGKYKGQVSRVDGAVKDSQVTDLVSKGADITDAEMFAPGKSYNPADLRKFRQGVAKGVNFNTDAVGQQGAKQAGGLIREQEMKLIENIDPALRAQNEGLFRQLHLNSLAEDMAESGSARSAVNNSIGMNSWKAAQVAGTTGVAGALDLFSTGGLATAALISREMTKRYGNQVTAVTLNKIAKAMQGGQFSAQFAKAAERGPQAVAALHMALLDDPAYEAEIK
jgi:hypothetical protein